MNPRQPAWDAKAVLDAMDGVAWLTDASGCIAALGSPNWETFADENGAPELADSDRVLGRRLLDFVSGDEVRAVYTRILNDLSAGRNGAVSLAIRCDAPELRRAMRLSISPVRAGERLRGFLFASVLLAEDQRPPVSLYDFAGINEAMKRRRGLPFVTVCSFCQMVRADSLADGDWLDAERYYRLGGRSEVALSHGVCGDCAEHLLPTEPAVG